MTKTRIMVSALLLAGSVATASAQTYEAPDVNTPIQFTSPDAYRARAQVVAPQAHRARAQVWQGPASTAVYENGKYIGQDPDPNVRTMLRRDFTFQ